MLLRTNLISPKEVEFFSLNCLVTFWNMLIQYSAKNLVWTQQSSRSLARTMLVFATAVQKTLRISEGKNSWKNCKSDAAPRGKPGASLFWSDKLQLNSPFVQVCSPVVWRKKVLNYWALIIKISGLQAEEDHPWMMQKFLSLKLPARRTWACAAQSKCAGTGCCALATHSSHTQGWDKIS